MRMLIHGEWVDRDDRIDVVDPYDGKVIDTVPSGTAADMKAAIDSAEEGFKINRDMPVYKRIEILKNTADIVDGRQEEYARIIASEGSKTIKEARHGKKSN